MNRPTLVLCNKCAATFEHDPRRLVGCNCDPDAPTWCWIEPNGDIRGLSAASWTAWK
jgi:hypothetical protein